MNSYIITTIWQALLFAIVVLLLVVAWNYRLLVSMLGFRKIDDFSYQDTYFVVYHGFLEDSPKLAILFWVSIIIFVAMSLFGFGKWVWVR